MKKIFILICIVGLFQSSMAQSISIGIKAGPNFAKLSGSQSWSTNYNNRTGWHGGAYALIKFGKIGIQPELLYSKQGASFNANIPSIGNSSNQAEYDYINVPIILKLYTIAGINLQLGPQFGFASGGQLKTTVNNTTTTQNYKDVIKGSDTSLAMGLGWDLPFGLSIDARYNLGLTNNNNTSTSGTVKNQVIMASVGYRLFKLGK